MSKKKTIKINHIAKMEGHTGFVAHILDGNVIKAKMETKEGSRLLEGVLLGRDYFEVPMITGRICGICPIVHFLSSTHAIEEAFAVKVSSQTIALRKVMELLQIIHSHALHLYFLSVPDFFDIENDLDFIKKHPKQVKAVLNVRQFAIDMVKLIGGRTVHPLTIEAGGFKKLPSIEEINKMLANYNSLLEDALIAGEFVRKIKYPEFENPTEYVCLYNKNEYEVLFGDLITSSGKKYTVKEFYYKIKELHQPFEKVKRTEYLGEPYFAGALARVINNFDKLNPESKKLWQKSKIPIPCYNNFYNVLAQAVEIVHSLEEINKIFKQLGKIDQKNTSVKVKPKAGEGWGAVEAPRGILLDYYKFDKNGKVLDANVITPTAQFLANLEYDLKAYVPEVLKLDKKQRIMRIRTLVRAYDPCISCATH